MDLSFLATKDTSNEGKWFRVELYDEEQDFQLLIYGSDCDAVTQYQKEQLKKLDIAGQLSGNKSNKKKTEKEIDELLDSDENVVIRLGGIKSWESDEPVVLNGRTLGNNREDYKYLIENIPALKGFILEKSNERTDFLPETKKNSKKQ